MQRLLYIEHSPTLRRGISRALHDAGLQLAAATAHEAMAETASPGDALLVNWATVPTSRRAALAEWLCAAERAHLPLVLLCGRTEALDDPRLLARPALQVLTDATPARICELFTRWQVPPPAVDVLPAPAPPAAPPAGTDATPPMRVLLVDDSRTSRHKYGRLLRGAGHEVQVCNDGLAALSLISTERFDAAIVDYYMPQLNGAEVCRAMRAHPATRAIPLAVLTGSYGEDLITDCLDAGADECMFKNEADGLFLARVRGMARLREREVLQREEHQRLAMILGAVGDGVYGVDREGRITFLNPAALRLLGHDDASALAGRLARQCIHHSTADGQPIAADVCFLQQAYEIGEELGHWETVFWRGDGTPMDVECTLRPLKNAEGGCEGTVVAFHDTTERRRFERELEWQTQHDPLTGLLNRRAFDLLLEQELARLSRSRGGSALLFMDLDRFKQINDTAGHDAGDALLKAIAERLRRRLRDVDRAARLGGDEFVVLLPQVAEAELPAMGEKIRALLDDARFLHDGRAWDISGSIGIVRLDRRTASAAQAMRDADAACQTAKRGGRNRSEVYHRDLHGPRIAASTPQSWTQRLQRALDRDEFELQYQPIADARSRRRPVFGHEVLLRLREGGQLVAPGAFMAQAERLTMLPAIDSWVLHTLQRQHTPLLRTPQRLHLNVGLSSLLDLSYRETLLDGLRQGRLPPELWLELPIDEVQAHLPRIEEALPALVDAGARIVLDGFGASLRGLSALERLPLAGVKLCGETLATLSSEARGLHVLRALVDLVHARDLYVIGARVERRSDLRGLRATGIDALQGHAIALPAAHWDHDNGQLLAGTDTGFLTTLAGLTDHPSLS